MGASPSRITGSRPSSDILRFQCATARRVHARPDPPPRSASSPRSRTPPATPRARPAAPDAGARPPRPPGAIARTPPEQRPDTPRIPQLPYHVQRGGHRTTDNAPPHAPSAPTYTDATNHTPPHQGVQLSVTTPITTFWGKHQSHDASESGSFGSVVLHVVEDVAGPAVQSLADRGERGEADRGDVVVLDLRQVYTLVMPTRSASQFRLRPRSTIIRSNRRTIRPTPHHLRSGFQSTCRYSVYKDATIQS